MISRLVRIQFAAFLVLAVVSVVFSLSFVGVPGLLGFGRLHLSVELPQSANLYPRAVVTLRGVPIGEVGALRLTATGVRAELSVRTAVNIPNDSVVSVRSVSAIGEQYLNFEPKGTGGQQLRDGDVIPSSAVRIPVDVNELLAHTNRLVASIPERDLNAAVDELSRAFSGTASNLRRLVDAGSDHRRSPAQPPVTDHPGFRSWGL